MRIVAGDFKGSTLYITKEKVTRPLKDLVRESLFNLLVHSNKIHLELEDANVLDLYSGIGSFGLECLSRRASKVYFVENNKTTFEILEKNIDKLKIKKKTEIFYEDVFDFIENKNFFNLKFDLIFCDPPFKSINMNKLIKFISQKKIINENGIIILHRNKFTQEKFPDFFQALEIRTYGLSKIIFGKILF